MLQHSHLLLAPGVWAIGSAPSGDAGQDGGLRQCTIIGFDACKVCFIKVVKETISKEGERRVRMERTKEVEGERTEEEGEGEGQRKK